MPIDERVDVLVVGARCAGAATAMLMARRGLKVLAIDRAAYGTDTMSTHAMMRGGVLQLRRWGLLPRIIELHTPAIRATTFHYGNEAIRLDIKPGDGVDALYAPRRMVLDSMLADAAQESGVDVRHQHALIELVRKPNGRVAGAVVYDPEGRRLEIAADLVVGADGAGSLIARMVGAAPTHTGRHAAAIVYGHWSGIAADGYRWDFARGASTGLIPTNAGRQCLFVAMPPRRFRVSDRRDLDALYRQVLDECSPELAAQLTAARLDGHLWPFAGRAPFMRRPYGPGWALVGDAGYFKDPLTAHGITDALRDAELLADAAAHGTPSSFGEYEEIRDALSLPLLTATDAVASFAWDFDQLKQHHQALNVAMKREVAHLAARQQGRALYGHACAH